MRPALTPPDAGRTGRRRTLPSRLPSPSRLRLQRGGRFSHRCGPSRTKHPPPPHGRSNRHIKEPSAAVINSSPSRPTSRNLLRNAPLKSAGRKTKLWAAKQGRLSDGNFLRTVLTAVALCDPRAAVAELPLPSAVLTPSAAAAARRPAPEFKSARRANCVGIRVAALRSFSHAALGVDTERGAAAARRWQSPTESGPVRT